jgi:hypothetical protein
VHVNDLLASLARPRLTGSAGAQEVADLVHERLIKLGYQIQDFPFSFSTWPGRFAISLAGALFIAGSIGAGALFTMGHPGVALVILLAMLLLIGSLVAVTTPLTDMLPFGRITANNMLAAKPDATPRYIFVAHLDSKSQPIPLAFRGPAIILALVSWLAFVVFALLGLLDAVWLRTDIALVLTVVCVLAGLLLVFCWVNNRSPGALDNASGVATILTLAESERDQDDVAFLFTDAEELGLVGARHVAGKLPPVFGIINVDGIDDEGTFFVMEKFGMPPRHIAPHLVASILQSADAMQLVAQRRNVPFGLMLDHLPFARAHLPAVTLMRGSFSSLQRVHRPADSLDRMTGRGIDSAVQLLRAALAHLRQEAATLPLVGNRPAR